VLAISLANRCRISGRVNGISAWPVAGWRSRSRAAITVRIAWASMTRVVCRYQECQEMRPIPPAADNCMCLPARYYVMAAAEAHRAPPARYARRKVGSRTHLDIVTALSDILWVPTG
jgi:hypothetical protein